MLNKQNILCMETLDITVKYKNIFIGEGKLEGKLHLEVDETVTPVKLPVRKLPIVVKDKLKTERAFAKVRCNSECHISNRVDFKHGCCK